MEVKLMEYFLTVIGILVTILIAIISYIKQKKDRETLYLKVLIGLSNIGAGKENRYEYIVINNSQKSAFITDVYIEFYEFNQYKDRIRYVGQVDHIDGSVITRNIPSLSSVRGWIEELDEFYKPNIFIRVVIYTQELVAFRSSFFDSRANVTIPESKIKKLKRKSNNHQVGDGC
jgi:hypothetical protein